jgi:hypothetical protein
VPSWQGLAIFEDRCRAFYLQFASVQLSQRPLLRGQKKVINMTFPDLAEGFTGFQGDAGLAFGAEIPAPAAVERKRILPTGDEIAAVLLQSVKWTLQTIKNTAQKSRAEPNRQWPVRCCDRFTDTESAIILKDLDCGDVAVETDHLTGQAAAADKYPVTDFQVGQVNAYRGATDTGDLTIHFCSLT